MAKFFANPDGVSTIYNTKAAELVKQIGPLAIRRASHVEPGSNLSEAAKELLRDTNRWDDQSDTRWFADMTPSTGEVVVLGPFDDNLGALAAEVDYLENVLHLRKLD